MPTNLVAFPLASATSLWLAITGEPFGSSIPAPVTPLAKVGELASGIFATWLGSKLAPNPLKPPTPVALPKILP